MKKKDVPQDKGLMEGRFEDVCYAVDENGNYVPVLSTGWEPKNDAMRLAWQEISEKVEQARQEVLSGNFSAIYFFMEKNLMDVKTLAAYMELPKRKVRRHLKPKHFKMLDEKTLARYAEVFNITPERLVQFKEEKVEYEGR